MDFKLKSVQITNERFLLVQFSFPTISSNTAEIVPRQGKKKQKKNPKKTKKKRKKS